MGIKYKVNENFFNEWSPVMAYVLGYWYADGSLYRAVRGHYLNITSIDKELIDKVKMWMRSKHSIQKFNFPKSARQTRYLLRIGNKQLFNSMMTMGLCPSKSLIMEFPTIPDPYLHHFVRGYFDGDGCVHLGTVKNNTGDKILKRISIIFTSGSEKFLTTLSGLLAKRLKLRQKRIYNSHRSYQLRYGTRDSLKMFSFLYADCPGETYLTRKLFSFKKYFALRPLRVNADIGKILSQYGHVAK